MDRRSVVLMPSFSVTAAVVGSLWLTPDADAIGFAKELKKRKVPLNEYDQLADFEWRGEQHTGVRYYDETIGRGRQATTGTRLTVNWESLFNGVTIGSSYDARTLNRNQTIAEPLVFQYGYVPPEYSKAADVDFFVGVGMRVAEDRETKLKYVEKVFYDGPAYRAGIPANSRVISVEGLDVAKLSNADTGDLLRGDEGTDVEVVYSVQGSEPKTATLTRARYAVEQTRKAPKVTASNGLYSGETGPKPPAAVFLALEGMREGGRRLVNVTPDIGYGAEGYRELPPESTFTLRIQLEKVENDA